MLRFLRDKPNQISGFSSESWPNREEIYHVFREKFQQNYPGALEKLEELDKSESSKSKDKLGLEKSKDSNNNYKKDKKSLIWGKVKKYDGNVTQHSFKFGFFENEEK